MSLDQRHPYNTGRQRADGDAARERFAGRDARRRVAHEATETNAAPVPVVRIGRDASPHVLALHRGHDVGAAGDLDPCLARPRAE